MGHGDDITFGFEAIGFEGELARCVERGEIEVVYQPIVDLVSNRTVGVEALARWRHPVLGLVQPAHFVPVAERTGDIVTIGRAVLQIALRQVAAWNAERRHDEQLRLHVNVAVRQLADFWLVDDVDQAITAAGFDPALLTLEITESAAVCQTFVGDTLAALKRLGVRLAIDDFGTGYSSLAYLTRLPVDEIKLDRSFLDDLGRDSGQALVASVLLLAARLGLATVVEGIETQAHVAQLVRIGARHGQGFHFSRPLPAAALALSAPPIPIAA